MRLKVKDLRGVAASLSVCIAETTLASTLCPHSLPGRSSCGCRSCMFQAPTLAPWRRQPRSACPKKHQPYKRKG